MRFRDVSRSVMILETNACHVDQERPSDPTRCRLQVNEGMSTIEAHAVGRLRCSARQDSRATPLNGMQDSALNTKQAMAPILDISAPAMAGPRMRDRLNCVELSARPRPIRSFDELQDRRQGEAGSIQRHVGHRERRQFIAPHHFSAAR